MQLELGDIAIDVAQKDIKNVHLSVHPPTGKVTISAPIRMDMDTIRVFAISKLGWIRLQQTKVREQERETEREYLDRESHYVWGNRCLLKAIEVEAVPKVELQHNTLLMQVRPGADEIAREALVANWYRQQLKIAGAPLIQTWETRLSVKADGFYIQKMKTKWGSCNPKRRTIRLNTELAKKPRECLEYIVVHELLHLIEPTHNWRFSALLDRFMPQWQGYRDTLNRLPVRHERWSY